MRNAKRADSLDCYVVEIFVPKGTRLEQTREFHTRNGIAERYLRYRTDDGDILYWRFSEPAYAEFFIAAFGGELVVLPTQHGETAKPLAIDSDILRDVLALERMPGAARRYL
ncbi:MAG TPA: hypothetical protein VFB29_17000 [Pseudolabrys sp.]|nr:hypothetical protein [Pseudolabrys sp.]